MAADHRQQWALKEGDRIRCADADYIISGAPIGYGGSAVVYQARRTDTHLSYAIKECFPKNGRFCRPNGVIQAEDPGDGEAVRLLEHFCTGTRTEQRIGQLIHNAGDRAVCIREILRPRAICFRGRTYDHIGGGCFAVLDRMDLKSRSFDRLLRDIREGCSPEEFRRTRGLPDIHTTACLMEEVLTALQQVHTARDPERPWVSGYYFGDLHGGNIHFTGSSIRDGVVGTAHLIDFGSARELNEEGFTEELLGRNVFSAPETRPPEMLGEGVFRLSRASDVFSAGCLMLRCVVTEEMLESLGEAPCIEPDLLGPTEGANIGCGPELLRLVNEILSRATAWDREDRYPDAAAMLEKIRQLKEESAPLKNRLGLGLSTLADGAFVGRDSDRRKLDGYLNNRRNPVVLWGFPGLGKTELAIEYGRQKSRSARVYFVRFAGSFHKTVTGPIADAFSGYRKTLPDSRPKPADQIFREVMELLGQCAPDDILIIDHVDSPTGIFADLRTGAYRSLCALPMHLILTTRSEPDGEGQWHEVGPLEDRHLYKLMERHGSWPRDQLKLLIDAVNSHTLTLDLMARTMAQSWSEITPEKLLRSLRSGDALPQVSTTHDRSGRQARLHGHLKALFDLSGMTADEITVLCCATLLPEDGMDAPLFKRSLGAEREQPALVRLTKSGWLTVADGRTLSIHPVVREVCRAELAPDAQRCGAFLEQLWDRRDEESTGASGYAQMAECFAASMALPGPRDPVRASHAGDLYRRIGRYGKNLEYARMALDIGRSTLPGESVTLAALYSNLGTACGDVGDYEQELEYHSKALQLRQGALPEDHPDLAVSYSSLGTAYGDRGDHRKDLEYQRMALKLRQRILSERDPALADSYSKVGSALCNIGSYAEGLANQQKALQLRQSALPADHLDLAVSHNNLGRTLCAQGRYRDALGHLLSSLQIRRARLPAMHPALAHAHHNLGIVYGMLGDYRKELEQHLQCLQIRREICSGDDPQLIEACDDVAKAYGKLGEYENELEYFLQTLQLQQAARPEDHPDLVRPYCHVAQAYQELGDREQQMRYLRKAAGAGDTGSMNRLANLLLSEGAHREAVSWLDRALHMGSRDAANNLGLLCLKGVGGPRDLRRGMELLRQAAEQDSVAAHRHLGRIYLGVHRDAPDYRPVDPHMALVHLYRARRLGANGDEALIRRAESMLTLFE